MTSQPTAPSVRCDSPPCRYWVSYAGTCRSYFTGFHGECLWHAVVKQPPFGAVCKDIHLVGKPLENCPAHEGRVEEDRHDR